jgi:RNA 2',3'-cyclic 3'-phosphodiesterase
MTTRTFIALELNTDQQRFLSTIIRQGQQLLPALRWVDPDGIHLTLAFLGELDDQQLDRAIAAAHAAAALSNPFTYALSSTGIFGPPRQPRVLYMGISEPSGLLNQVHQTVKLALEERHFTTEKRPFSPHLTLARIKSPLSQEQLQLLQQFISRYQFSSPLYRVTHLYVMKSELTQNGARYTCLQACPFLA